MNQPRTTPAPMFLPTLLFGYMILVQLALPTILVVLYENHSDPFARVNATAIAPHGWSDVATLVAYAIGLAALFAAATLPRALAKQAPSRPTPPMQRLFVSYIIRISLFETCSMAGFVLGILSGALAPIFPLWLLGFGGTVISAPTQGFFTNFRASLELPAN